MKRCPQCNRFENDEALVFCRIDGTPLVADSSPRGSEAGTAQLNSKSGANEFGTSVLPHTTNSDFSRKTGPTTVLAQPTSTVPYELVKAGPRRRQVLAAVAIVLVVIVIGGYSVFVRRNRAIESIAVLPFENKSGNADSEYLSDGLAESLIYRLSQLPNLKVSPTSSVMRYKGTSTEPVKIGTELGVRQSCQAGWCSVART